MSQQANREAENYDIDNIAQKYLSLITNTVTPAKNKNRKLSLPKELDMFPSILRWTVSLVRQDYRAVSWISKKLRSLQLVV
jgi:hypothetical protein